MSMFFELVRTHSAAFCSRSRRNGIKNSFSHNRKLKAFWKFCFSSTEASCVWHFIHNACNLPRSRNNAASFGMRQKSFSASIVEKRRPDFKRMSHPRHIRQSCAMIDKKHHFDEQPSVQCVVVGSDFKKRFEMLCRELLRDLPARFAE